MEAIVLIIVVWIVIAVIRAAGRSAQQKHAASKLLQHVQEARRKGIAVRCADDTFTPDSGGPSMPLKSISISGSIVVPKPNQHVRIKIALADITSSSEDAYPVFCMIPELCDEDGLFQFDQPTTIPYEFSEISDMVLGTIPLFALVCPAKGARRLRLSVVFVDAADPDRAFTFGTSTFSFVQDTLGYLEIQERTRARERQIASLALAISASDGHIDKRESAVIRRFFAERYARVDDTGERRAKVTEALKETLSRLKEVGESSSQVISELCVELAGDSDEAVAQTAYELCVQIVAADEVVDKREQRALSFIADQLELPEQYVREVHDRNLRMSMYDETEEEQLIGMPRDLSHEEKLEHLNAEYRRWRARVTHKDPEVAAEATLRLERITKLRRQLTDVAS